MGLELDRPRVDAARHAAGGHRAARSARARLLDDPARSWWRLLLPALAGGGLLALGYGLAAAHGWGMILLAATTIAFMVALAVGAGPGGDPGGGRACRRKGMSWLMLPLAGFGGWLAGLAALFAYAVG